MSGTTYYQRNKAVILNIAKYCYTNNKDELKLKARNKYRKLSEEEKNKKREYGRNIYNNMPEEKKQRLKEYQRNYREAKKQHKRKTLKKTVLSNKTLHGKQGANKYYIAYLSGGFTP